MISNGKYQVNHIINSDGIIKDQVCGKIQTNGGFQKTMPKKC